MAFERCIRTKLCEAIRLLWLADSTVQDYWGTRISVGRQQAQDGNVITPQLVIVPEALTFEPGVSGVTRTQVAVRFGMFEPYRREPEPLGDVKAECKLAHLEYLISRGTPGQEAEGSIVDPDNPNSADSVTRILNISDPDFREETAIELLPKRIGNPDAPIVPIALVYPVLVIFETRLDNVTQQRR